MAANKSRLPGRIVTGLLLILSVACTSMTTENPAPDALLTEVIDSLITNWHHMAATSEHDAYIGLMSEDGVYLGTDATEYWTTRQFSQWSKPYFDQKKGWNLESIQRHIYLGKHRETAWFDELLDTGMGLCRGSGVLQKVNGQWKICQYVLSQTIPNELTKQVKELKKKNDSLLIHQLVH